MQNSSSDLVYNSIPTLVYLTDGHVLHRVALFISAMSYAKDIKNMLGGQYEDWKILKTETIDDIIEEA